jgi:hypothetical protein
MLAIVLLFIFFTWCIVSALKPTEHKPSNIIIHNNIHVDNTSEYTNTSSYSVADSLKDIDRDIEARNIFDRRF